MNKTTTAIVLVGGGLLLGLGLLFLCASAAAPEKAFIRILLSALLIVIGAASAIWAGRNWRRLSDIDPARLADRIVENLKLQKKFETTAPEAVAELGAPAANVAKALELLQQRGEAQPEQREDRFVYVFPNLKEGLMIRRCSYCGTTYPVKQAISICTVCGGKVELVRT